MGSEERFLVPCRVSPGFFSREVLVMVAGSSAYVDRDSVRTSGDPRAGEVDGLVSVYLIRATEDQALIELPGQPVVGGARTWVAKGLLSPASA